MTKNTETTNAIYPANYQMTWKELARVLLIQKKHDTKNAIFKADRKLKMPTQAEQIVYCVHGGCTFWYKDVRYKHNDEIGWDEISYPVKDKPGYRRKMLNATLSDMREIILDLYGVDCPDLSFTRG